MKLSELYENPDNPSIGTDEDIKPEEVIQQLNLRTPTFKRLCKEGLI